MRLSSLVRCTDRHAVPAAQTSTGADVAALRCFSSRSRPMLLLQVVVVMLLATLRLPAAAAEGQPMRRVLRSSTEAQRSSSVEALTAKAGRQLQQAPASVNCGNSPSCLAACFVSGTCSGGGAHHSLDTLFIAGTATQARASILSVCNRLCCESQLTALRPVPGTTSTARVPTNGGASIESSTSSTPTPAAPAESQASHILPWCVCSAKQR